ncbi:hypothetical protein TsFJ059_000359 [Trichoderma semiorbis]|uniref:Uncharacterized protein n=1 Tax=Trichoderma semiorbis TaxID=1491008 RepID=A0A9P8HPD7_9HYPO|nr:hypothetical protein TsFJ059_000359 [Trichoderma semiorbis]
MLSRAVNVPRACFANRLSSSILSARATLSNRSLHSRGEWIQQRCYSSDPVIHSKEKIEALISGRISEREFKKSNKQTSKRPSKKSSSHKPWRRRREEEIPDWGGLAPLEIEASPATQAAVERHLRKGFESELSEELREMLAEESLIKEESAAEELDAEERNQPEQSTSEEGATITEADAVEPSQPRPKRGFKAKKDFHDELVQSRSVPVAALGEQIDAIMLKNPNEMKRPKRPVRRVQEDAVEATVELDTERDNMMDVKEESDEEAMRAAMKNIDDLRPVDKTILRMKDFDSLANTLVDGFTFNQLAKYFNQKRLALSSKRDRGKQLRYPWIMKQEPWVAAKPDHWGPLRPKQRQVIMIMQIIWNLEVQEQVEGLGRTLVWLQPRIFELIASPNSSVLELLSRDFLYQSNKEKITTSFEDYRINIYARKSTIPAILSNLDETVKSIRSQNISSGFIQEHDQDEKLLRELERITKTHIAYDENNKELEISWLQKHHLASTGTESPADIASRLLLEQTTKDTQTSVHIITPSDISNTKGGGFVSHQRENRMNPDSDLTGSSLPPGSALFGVAAQHINDVLLPSESVDVRLTQNYLLPLDASQESVKEFLSQSEFNLPQGVLQTPSKAKFSIPKAWVTKAKTTRKPSKATINVPYIFMGLEIHQTVQLEFHGHTLCYNCIDAGRHGGHRQELSLKAGPPQGPDEPPFTLNEAEASRFLSLVEGVATGKYFSWHNGSQFMRETPDVGTLEDAVTEDQLSPLEAEAEDYEHIQSTESEPLQNTKYEDNQSSTETAPDITIAEPAKDSHSPNPDKTKEPERE